MKKTACFLWFLCLLSALPHRGVSQQTALFSEYNFVPFWINPAFAGMGNGAELSLSSHGFLNSIEGTPRTHSVGFSAPLEDQNLGLGAVVNQDKIGVTTTSQAYAAISYKIRFGASNNRSYLRTPYWRAMNQKVFSFGMTAGYRRHLEDLLELGLPDDPQFAENISASTPIIGVGVLYNTADFFVGLSSPNLLGNTFVKKTNVNLTNPVYGYLGYRYLVGAYTPVMLKPSLLVKYEQGAPVQLDANFSVSFADKLEVGAGYRSSSSVNMLVGVYALDHLRLIYQFNAGIQNSFLGNSHGITLSYFLAGLEE